MDSVKQTCRAILGGLARYWWLLSNGSRLKRWFLRRSDIEMWFDNERVIEAAINSDSLRIAKEKVVFDDFREFNRLNASIERGDLRLDWDDRYLCLDDKTQETGFDRHYIYHPAWAARVLAKIQPSRHTDISSTLNFCAIVSAFFPIDFYDFRPAPLYLSNLNSRAADLMDLSFADESIESLSCMHVIEHIGLGRYGDPIDPNGDVKAIKELCRVLQPGGNLLVVVPIGEARVQFNAHRVYKHRDFISYFNDLDLVEFALIPDGPVPYGLLYSPSEDDINAQKYGCGCYWFRKPVLTPV